MLQFVSITRWSESQNALDHIVLQAFYSPFHTFSRLDTIKRHTDRRSVIKKAEVQVVLELPVVRIDNITVLHLYRLLQA